MGAPYPPGYPPALTCYRHPDRQTYVRCTRCGRPVCRNACGRRRLAASASVRRGRCGRRASGEDGAFGFERADRVRR